MRFCFGWEIQLETKLGDFEGKDPVSYWSLLPVSWLCHCVLLRSAQFELFSVVKSFGCVVKEENVFNGKSYSRKQN